ncbi:hypothetical protein ACUW9Z_000873 [Aerococcus sp. 150760007-1]|uniref:HTH cro/C1-type domain-containing protein n=1 Tax=Aerococcus urinaeequi TaxID=51665 RepID=A0ABR5ZY60_9LACT|nr:hypothetical protein [Aerococcus urinaeequi]MBA5746596.1 hypothetical protein [Aerococcus urinaeequi]MBA5829353.1 hypothetical protein [Aerococcus urinaeequi]MBA5860284.1 hypothetical protein [Aerococcus urinaeequi]
MTLKADDLIPVDKVKFTDEDLEIGLINRIKNSEQYKYSEKILDLRYENGLSLEDMVKITELTKYEYVSLECSDIAVDVSVYKSAIKNIVKKINDVKNN